MPVDRHRESQVQLSEEQIGSEMVGDSAVAPGNDPVCTFLLENDRLKSADLKRAQNYQDQHGGDLVTLLVRLGLVSERDVAEAEAGLLDLDLLRTADLPDEAPEVPDISVRFLKQNLILPIAESNGDLTVVMANPRDEFARKALSMASGKNIVTRVGIASEIENGIEKLLGGGRSAMGQIVDSLGGEEEGDLEDVEHLRDLASEAPVIRLSEDRVRELMDFLQALTDPAMLDLAGDIPLQLASGLQTAE